MKIRYLSSYIRNSLPKRISAAVVTTAITVLSLGTSYADDTEVFFGQVDRTQSNQPNVLFVLDTSGSMNWRDEQVEGNETRLERMKEAMTTILNQSNDVNVGLMRFNGAIGGGSIIYPITPIDEEICASNECGEIQITSKINSITDDAEQRGSGKTTPQGDTLSLQTADPDRLVGFRFNALEIPQGATITNATISVVAKGKNDIDGTDTIKIKVQDDKSAQTFTDNEFDISSRPFNIIADWNPGPWEDQSSYETSDLSELVQQVVNRGDWCGGNSMAFSLSGSAVRDMVAYDDFPENAAVLNVTYDSSTIPVGGGCIVKHAVSTINASYNDAEEIPGFFPNVTSGDLEMFTDFNRGQVLGLRFTNVQIPKNADILESYIEFEMDRNSFGDNSAIIYGENKDTPEIFRRRGWDISNRARTGQNVPWNKLPARKTNDKLFTPSLNNIVTELTRRNGWNTGNTMAFIMVNNGSTGKHPAESFDGNSGEAPKLIVKYRSFIQPTGVTPTYVTARDRLLREVSTMTATGGTPIVDAYYEATQYMLGDDVDFGRTRGIGNQVSRFHRVSHPLSYVGGSLIRSGNCSDQNLDDPSCSSERINASPRYISPIESSCQTNHIVLLSDGDATNHAASQRVQQKIGKQCEPNNNNAEHCGTDLAYWLANTDHSPDLKRDQTIKTYTIGFNVDHPFLQNIAAEGNGDYFRADSADQLVARFEDILADVNAVDTSFVAPGATVNQFNRLTHRSDIYFALFRPDDRPTWSGNLKKYQVGLDDDENVVIYDHNTPRENAIDSEEGFFAETARSDWSVTTDGSDVALGGAAEVLSNKSENGTGPDARKMFTILSDLENIPTSGYSVINDGDIIHEDNTAFNDSHFSITSTDGNVDGVDITRPNILQWLRGIDVKDEDADDDRAEFRNHIGDPMHSRPVIVNYANGSSDPYTTIFMGTNEGVLHGINNVDGEELFSFIPPSLLANVKENFINSASTRHQYGLDGPMTTWTVDKNNNVVVDSNEVAMLYLGMRRGGSNYYAFDVSRREDPILKWVIKGGEGDFLNLGQSWSRMVPTKIRYQGKERNVLIFGGGYDTSNDVDHTIGALPKEVDSIGNSIFIVDANTGDLIYELGHTNNINATQKFADMEYAIPSDIRVLDIDGDGFADAMFVGDLGGQVWRFDFDLYHSSTSNTRELIMGNQPLAKLGLPHSNLANNRRFFYEPDVALIRENGERYLSISIGSGWRSHPLNTDVDEAFYMIRSNDVFNLPDGYGKRLPNGTYEPLRDADLTDVSNKIDQGIGPYGWQLVFNDLGEKTVGEALTVNSQIVFTTYLPESGVSLCSPELGSGAAYALRVSDGRPALDLDNDGSKDINDRRTILSHAGVPPEATALIVQGESGKIAATVLAGTEQPFLDKDGNNDIFAESLTERGSWVDAGMTEEGAQGASLDDN